MVWSNVPLGARLKRDVRLRQRMEDHAPTINMLKKFTALIEFEEHASIY